MIRRVRVEAMPEKEGNGKASAVTWVAVTTERVREAVRVEKEGVKETWMVTVPDRGWLFAITDVP